jgi:hypothetical protein
MRVTGVYRNQCQLIALSGLAVVLVAVSRAVQSRYIILVVKLGELLGQLGGLCGLHHAAVQKG